MPSFQADTSCVAGSAGTALPARPAAVLCCAMLDISRRPAAAAALPHCTTGGLLPPGRPVGHHPGLTCFRLMRWACPAAVRLWGGPHPPALGPPLCGPLGHGATVAPTSHRLLRFSVNPVSSPGLPSFHNLGSGRRWRPAKTPLIKPANGRGRILAAGWFRGWPSLYAAQACPPTPTLLPPLYLWET